MFKTLLQKVTTHSTCEAEFLGASEAIRDVVFVRMFAEELGFPQTGPTELLVDNEAAVKLTQNKILTGKTKTVQRKENYVREMHHEGIVKCNWVSKDLQTADIMTKNLPLPLFQRFRDMIME